MLFLNEVKYYDKKLFEFLKFFKESFCKKILMSFEKDYLKLST